MINTIKNQQNKLKLHPSKKFIYLSIHNLETKKGIGIFNLFFSFWVTQKFNKKSMVGTITKGDKKRRPKKGQKTHM
jgi:hypothetical protein